MERTSFVLTLIICVPVILFAQERINGPVVQEYGETFHVPAPDFKTDTQQVYKVLFDIHNSPEDPSKMSSQLNTLARFLNMHVAAGVPRENIHLAGVIHNKASKDAMNHEAYRTRYGIDNPNLELIEALDEAGVDIYMCGQSIYARKIQREELAASIQVGLSTMTVILAHQAKGYQLIRF